MCLKDEGYAVATACDGLTALGLVAGGMVQPDLILADCNLPNGMKGSAVATLLREDLQTAIPVIILTGDVSTETSDIITRLRYVQLNKPVKLTELSRTIETLMPPPRAAMPNRARQAAEPESRSKPPLVFVVDDDNCIRGTIRAVLEDDGRDVEDFDTCEAFLAAFRPRREACLVIDAYLPGMNGIALLHRLHDRGYRLPAIMITGNSDVAMSVQAMKAGASDFIEKPISRSGLLACVDRALGQARASGKLTAWRKDAADHVAELTARQRQIMELVLAGHPSKNIAADLGISQRTVENHRASIMTRTGTKSLPALARLALAAAVNDADDPAGLCR